MHGLESRGLSALAGRYWTRPSHAEFRSVAIGSLFFMMNCCRGQKFQDFFERVVMIGTDRVYLSPSKMHEVGAIAPHFVLDVCKVPHDYISANWPIRVRIREMLFVLFLF